MKRKKLSFSVPVEDVRAIANTVVGLQLARFGKKYTEIGVELDEASRNGTNIDILEKLQSLVDLFEESTEEIERVSELIESVPPVEEAEEEAEEETVEEEPKKKDFPRLRDDGVMELADVGEHGAYMTPAVNSETVFLQIRQIFDDLCVGRDIP